MLTIAGQDASNEVDTIMDTADSGVASEASNLAPISDSVEQSASFEGINSDDSDDYSAISDDDYQEFASIDDSLDGSEDYDYGSIDVSDYDDINR